MGLPAEALAKAGFLLTRHCCHDKPSVMAAKREVLAELGNVIVQAAKVVKERNTRTQLRAQWMKVLVDSSKAYAAIEDAGPAPKKK